MPEKAEGDKSKVPNKTRLKKMRDEAGDPELQPDRPPCECVSLVNYLFEIGPVLYGGMGAAPLSYQEIESWQTQTGISLDVWEVRLLRQMSVAYLSETHRAEKMNCPSPWQAESEQEFEIVARSLEADIERMLSDI